MTLLVGNDAIIASVIWIWVNRDVFAGEIDVQYDLMER